MRLWPCVCRWRGCGWLKPHRRPQRHMPPSTAGCMRGASSSPIANRRRRRHNTESPVPTPGLHKHQRPSGRAATPTCAHPELGRKHRTALQSRGVSGGGGGPCCTDGAFAAHSSLTARRWPSSCRPPGRCFTPAVTTILSSRPGTRGKNGITGAYLLSGGSCVCGQWESASPLFSYRVATFHWPIHFTRQLMGPCCAAPA